MVKRDAHPTLTLRRYAHAFPDGRGRVSSCDYIQRLRVNGSNSCNLNIITNTPVTSLIYLTF